MQTTSSHWCFTRGSGRYARMLGQQGRRGQWKIFLLWPVLLEMLQYVAANLTYCIHCRWGSRVRVQDTTWGYLGSHPESVHGYNCAICTLLWQQFLQSQLPLLGLSYMYILTIGRARMPMAHSTILRAVDRQSLKLLCSGAKLSPGYWVLVMFLCRGNALSATKMFGIAPSVCGRG